MGKLKLENKIAVITGGAGEIGQCIAATFLAEGATVILTGLTEEKLRTVTEQLRSSFSAVKDQIFFRVADSSNETALKELFQFLQNQFGRVDILVNNAGAAGSIGVLSEISLAKAKDGGQTLNESINSLLIGPWLTTHALLPILASKASIINISSIFSRTPYYGRAAYVVPKAALNVLSRIFASELGDDPRGIRVNTVFPGPVETNRIRRVMGLMDSMKNAPEGQTKKTIFDQMRLHKQLKTEFIPREDVANTVLFLSSDDSGSYTAHDFEVTRGLKTNDEVYRIPTKKNKNVLNPTLKQFVWIIAHDQIEEVTTSIETLRTSGVEVLVTFSDSNAFVLFSEKSKNIHNVDVKFWNPHNSELWPSLEIYLQSKSCSNWSCFVLQSDFGTKQDSHLTSASYQAISQFSHSQIESSIIVAKYIDQMLKFHDSRLKYDTSVVFVSFSATGTKSKYQEIRRSSVNQLIRVWRDEISFDQKNNNRLHGLIGNQVIEVKRKDTPKNSSFMEYVINFALSKQVIDPIDLSVDENLISEKIAQSGYMYISRNQLTPGLHCDCVAVITGGAEGIGGAITRQLARSGARIVIAERSSDKLHLIHAALVEEMNNFGFSAENRILVLPDRDVTKKETLYTVIEETVQKFGRLDFLINNAGLVGAEEMLVDISLSSWNQTIYGNLISNYQLILDAVPIMLKQRYGHVINMSSYFGGDRHGAVPYTNRVDYAVSKGGQIALTQALADLLGPDIQINTLAPGPVDGARLNGTAGRPGLYQRRARLLYENKRLNQVYNAVTKSIASGYPLEEVIHKVQLNSIDTILDDSGSPTPLTELARLYLNDKTQLPSSSKYLLPHPLYIKFLNRLVRSGYESIDPSSSELKKLLNEPPEVFFNPNLIESDAASIRNRMIDHMALKHAPSDDTLAEEVISTLSHRTLTGEVIYPTCGFRYDGFYVGDTFCGNGTELAYPSSIDSTFSFQLINETVFILGDSMYEEIVQLAARYHSAHAKVVILTFSDLGHKTILKYLTKSGVTSDILLNCESLTIPQALNDAYKKFGKPSVVLSMPMKPIGMCSEQLSQGLNKLPTLQEFIDLIETNITNHFLVLQKTTLIDDCRTILICPTESKGRNTEQKRWIQFIRTTLRPLTLAASSEAIHLNHGSSVYQVGHNVANDSFYKTILLASLSSQTVSEKEEKRAA